MEELLREKRLRWFGHLIREQDDDPAKQTLLREKELNSKWFQLLTADLLSRRTTFDKAVPLANDRAAWRRLSFSICEEHLPPGARAD